jgi:hypothetical protein
MFAIGPAGLRSRAAVWQMEAIFFAISPIPSSLSKV